MEVVGCGCASTTHQCYCHMKGKLTREKLRLRESVAPSEFSKLKGDLKKQKKEGRKRENTVFLGKGGRGIGAEVKNEHPNCKRRVRQRECDPPKKTEGVAS